MPLYKSSVMPREDDVDKGENRNNSVTDDTRNQLKRFRQWQTTEKYAGSYSNVHLFIDATITFVHGTHNDIDY